MALSELSLLLGILAGEFFAGEVFLLEGRVWEVFYRAVTALHVYIALCALYKHYTVYCTQDLHPQ